MIRRESKSTLFLSEREFTLRNTVWEVTFNFSIDSIRNHYEEY